MTVTATLLVTASRADTQRRGLLITAHDKADTRSTAWFRVYPDLDPADLRIAAIGGTVTRVGVREEDVSEELLGFSGGTEATPARWPWGRFAVIETSDAYDLDGAAIDFPTLSASDETGFVRADRDEGFFGYAKVSYTTRYVLYRFTRDADPLAQEAMAFSDYYGSTRYGIPTSLSGQEYEIARVTSRYLVDTDGAWEMPVGYPSELEIAWDGGSHTLDPASVYIFGRAHAILYMQPPRGLDQVPTWRLATFSPPAHPPYPPHPTSGYSYAATTYDDAEITEYIASLDWSDIETTLGGLYPGIEVEAPS